MSEKAGKIRQNSEFNDGELVFRDLIITLQGNRSAQKDRLMKIINKIGF